MGFFNHARAHLSKLVGLKGAPHPLGMPANQPYSTAEVDSFGRVYLNGKRTYAQPQNGFFGGTAWAQVPQFNFDNMGKQWGYSFAYPTVNTVFPQVSGNPPQGGFSTPVVIQPLGG